MIADVFESLGETGDEGGSSKRGQRNTESGSLLEGDKKTSTEGGEMHTMQLDSSKLAVETRSNRGCLSWLHEHASLFVQVLGLEGARRVIVPTLSRQSTEILHEFMTTWKNYKPSQVKGKDKVHLKDLQEPRRVDCGTVQKVLSASWLEGTEFSLLCDIAQCGIGKKAVLLTSDFLSHLIHEKPPHAYVHAFKEYVGATMTYVSSSAEEPIKIRSQMDLEDNYAILVPGVWNKRYFSIRIEILNAGKVLVETCSSTGEDLPCSLKDRLTTFLRYLLDPEISVPKALQPLLKQDCYKATHWNVRYETLGNQLLSRYSSRHSFID